MAKKKAAKVNEVVKDARAYVMQCNLTVNGDPYASLSLEELEKAFDLAGARFTYAHEQQDFWRQEIYSRGREFSRVTAAFKQRKHGFTDEQIKENPKTSSSVWSYAK